MSQYSEIMDELATLREQNDWLVSAVKHMLTHPSQAAWQPEAPVEEFDDEMDLDLADEIPPDAGDVLVPIHAARPKNRCGHARTTTKNGVVTCASCGADLGCAHNRQGVDEQGRLACNRCGALLNQSGVLNDPNRNGIQAARTEWGRNSLRESNPLPG